MRGVLLVLCLGCACEKADRVSARDAAPRPADAAPRVPDASLPPDAPLPVPDAAPPPDAARAPDAGPRRRSKAFDACETDDECTTYGDPCGGGMLPVNKGWIEEARAAAQKRCPGRSMNYLIARSELEGRCVKHRCRHPYETSLDGLFGK